MSDGGSPPAFTTVRVDVVGRLGRLTLDQPARLNPLGATVLRELVAAAGHFDRAGVGVVIVTGAGRAFSAGFDRRELTAVPDPDPSMAPGSGSSVPELGAEMARAVASMRAVTIAALNGLCLGGGLVLATACDLRIAAEDAWFSLPEVDLGIPLAWTGVPRLVREIGPARTLELVLTCRRFDAIEAATMGLLNRVVPAGDLDRTVDELAEKILAQRPGVVATTKQQVSAAAEALVPSTGEWSGTAALVAALRELLAGGA